MAIWLLLLAFIIFFMYMWNSQWVQGEPKQGCNTCPGKKNVGVE